MKDGLLALSDAEDILAKKRKIKLKYKQNLKKIPRLELLPMLKIMDEIATDTAIDERMQYAAGLVWHALNILHTHEILGEDGGEPTIEQLRDLIGGNVVEVIFDEWQRRLHG